MEGDGFGVSVDLSSFFSDERARVRVWVPRAGAGGGGEGAGPAGPRAGPRRVRWLCARLRRSLRLPAAPALLAGGALLLPGDPLALLQPGEQLRAIPSKSEWFLESDRGRSSDDDCDTKCSAATDIPVVNHVPLAPPIRQSGTSFLPAELTVNVIDNEDQNHVMTPGDDTLDDMKKCAPDLLYRYEKSAFSKSDAPFCNKHGNRIGNESLILPDDNIVVDSRATSRSPQRAVAPDSDPRPASTSTSSSTSPPPQPADIDCEDQNHVMTTGDDTLQVMKKRALDLLYRYEKSYESSENDASLCNEGLIPPDNDVVDSRDRSRSPRRSASGPPRPRRRRARRRPRRSPPQPADTPPLTTPLQAAVLRNAAPRAAAPRLVRAAC